MRRAQRTMIMIAAFLVCLSSQLAFSATLKKDVTVYTNVVKAKHLFHNAGEFAEEPLFLAPDIGQSGTISAFRVAQEAHDIGLYDVSLNGIESVTVTRPSQKVRREDIQVELKEQITKALNSGIDFEITTSSIPEIIHADARIAKVLSIGELRLLENDRRFQATASIKTYNGPVKVPVRGVIIEMTTVTAITRDVKRDEVLIPGDVEHKRLVRSRVRPNTLSSLEGLIGKAVTRNLSKGSILQEQDVIEPLVVRTNDPVSITYSIPGLILTAQGRALDSGAVNDLISVRNLQSRRVVRARVSDKGEVVVDVKKPLFANNFPSVENEVQ